MKTKVLAFFAIVGSILMLSSCEPKVSLSKDALKTQEIEAWADSVSHYLNDNYNEGDTILFIRENGVYEYWYVANCTRLCAQYYRENGKNWSEEDDEIEKHTFTRKIDALELFVVFKDVNTNQQNLNIVFNYLQPQHHQNTDYDYFENFSIGVKTSSQESHMDFTRIDYSLDMGEGLICNLRKNVGVVFMSDGQGHTWTRPED